MRKIRVVGGELLVLVLGIWVGWGVLAPEAAFGKEVDEAQLKAEFFKLCDVAVRDLNKDKRRVHKRTRRVQFYQDSYAVRALCVAYDMTGKKAYLDACKKWSDRMVGFQEGMRLTLKPIR